MSRVWKCIERQKKLKLVIEEDENVGFYLIIYPIDSNISIKDFLCDDFEEAIIEAQESFGVKTSQWKEEK